VRVTTASGPFGLSGVDPALEASLREGMAAVECADDDALRDALRGVTKELV